MLDQAEVLKMEMSGFSEKMIGNGAFQLTGQLKVHTHFFKKYLGARSRT
jgi:hypothetical protein